MLQLEFMLRPHPSARALIKHGLDDLDSFTGVHFVFDTGCFLSH